MKIRKFTKKNYKRTIEIVKKFYPKRLDNFAINKSMPLDLKIYKEFAAEKKDQILGFITYTSNESETKIS